MDSFIARQPIFNSKRELFAYELLFRDGLSNQMPMIDGDVATSKLLSNTFFTIGIDKITAGRRAFINYTEKLLLNKTPLLFPKETTVIEILEDVKPDPQVVRVVQDFSASGYMLALDDFVFRADLIPFIEVADIIKIDFRLTPIQEIETYIEKGYLKNTALLAEKSRNDRRVQPGPRHGVRLFSRLFFQQTVNIERKGYLKLPLEASRNNRRRQQTGL